MERVTRQSKKDELWQELERAKSSGDQHRQQATLLEAEVQKLREENERLRERAIFAAEVSETARATNEKLEILTSLTKELASFDLDGVLEVSVQRIPYLVGARYASVYVHDSARGVLILKHHTHGREIDKVVDLRANPHSLMAVAVRTKKTLCIDDLGRWSAPDGETAETPHQQRYQTRSCVVAPLIAGGAVQGVLNLADRFDQRPFDAEAQMSLVRQARDLVAVSLRNARLWDQVQRAAQSCSLTGLVNHQAFVEALEAEVRKAGKSGAPLALLVINLRGLRLLNANHGHQAGDAVLIQAAHMLRQVAREQDIAGRIGGSELALLLPMIDAKGARAEAERIGGTITGTRFLIGSDTCTIPATLGLAVYRRHSTGADLLREALEAVDRARAKGEVLGVPGDDAQDRPAG